MWASLLACGSSAPTAVSVSLPRSAEHTSHVEAAPIAVSVTKGTLETTYSAVVGECRFALTVFEPSSVNTDVGSFRGECDLTTEDARRAAPAVLGAVVGARSQSPPFRTLFLGGIAHIMSVRLATLALGSPAWNARSGVPTNGRLNAAIKELASPDRLMPELVAVFRERSLCLDNPSVESVEVDAVARLPIKDKLIESGAKPTDRVPWSALLWYRVQSCN